MPTADPGSVVAPGEQRRVSVSRLVLVVLLVAGLLGLGAKWGFALVARSSDTSGGSWFAPYIDVTLTPTLHFEDAAEQPAKHVVLGFVVADPTDGCTPSWGSYYSLDAAARALDLDRRIVRLRERGGDAVVSFGGAINDELAVACTDASKLASAYQQVADRYGVRVLDFDIEGTSLANREANARRAAAIHDLQSRNPSIQVWLTLPVDPNGLPGDAVDLIDGMLAADVRLDGVNLMTMNYSESRPPTMSMRDATSNALLATWQQLHGAYQRAGITLTDAELWHRIGATPMIGQNDVANDVFSLADAQDLVDFARLRGLGRLSFWSANRDVRCGAGVADRRASNTCSGIEQQPVAFTELFAKATSGNPDPASAPPATVAANGAYVPAIARDDPRTSPYPIWRQGKAYEEGAKVVWQSRVYQAKWWTENDQPDAPVKHTWDTPWRYLGPVLASDIEALRTPAPMVDGQYPRWGTEQVYVAGERVEYEGKVFKAKWWTQGDTPQEDPDQPYDHPWEYVGKAKTAG